MVKLSGDILRLAPMPFGHPYARARGRSRYNIAGQARPLLARDLLNILPFAGGFVGFGGRGLLKSVFRSGSFLRKLPARAFYGALGTLGAAGVGGYLYQKGKREGFKSLIHAPFYGIKKAFGFGRKTYEGQQEGLDIPQGTNPYMTPLPADPITPLNPTPDPFTPPKGNGFIPTIETPPVTIPFTGTQVPSVNIFGGGTGSDFSQLAILLTAAALVGAGGYALYRKKKKKKKRKVKKRGKR